MMTAQSGFPPPSQPYMEPPEKSTVKTFVHIAGILALIFGIIFIIIGVVSIIFIVGIVPLIFGIIDIVIWRKTKAISNLVDQGQLTQAKSQTLVWMIIGFILGGIIIGILMLLAYLKFDDLIRAYQNMATPGQQM